MVQLQEINSTKVSGIAGSFITTTSSMRIIIYGAFASQSLLDTVKSGVNGLPVSILLPDNEIF